MSMILGLGEIFGNEELWPLLLALIGIPAVIQVILLPAMPDSPKYLILTKGDLIEGKLVSISVANCLFFRLIMSFHNRHCPN